MSEPEERPRQPEPFLRGVAWPAGGGMPYPRCDPSPEGLRLPADTREMAALPVGVRLGFSGDCTAIEIDYRTETDDLGYRGPGAGTEFVAFRGDTRVGAVHAVLGEGSLRLPCGAGSDAVTVYLPEGMRPLVLEVRAIDGTMEPLPPQPRWLCYGDSIAEGWCATEPSRAWPHVAARRHGLDVVNHGYAGAARGEIPSAQDLASLPADVISIAHGTNCWTRTPHSADLFRAGLRDFLTIVRGGHPQTPIVAFSPILRPDAEDTTNILGARLRDLRSVFETVVEERRAAGDEALRLVRGRDVVGPEHLTDGIHPGDEGHERIADVLGPAIVSALG